MTKTILWKQGRGFADWFRESQYKGSHGRRHGDNCKSSSLPAAQWQWAFSKCHLLWPETWKQSIKIICLCFSLCPSISRRHLGLHNIKGKKTPCSLCCTRANAKMITDLLVKSCNSKGKVWATKQLRFNTSSFAQTWWRVLSNPEMQ